MESNRGLRNIPSVDYCRVSRASEVLGCSVEDIIYWAGERKIKLCVKLYDAKGKLLIPALQEPAKILMFLIEMMNVSKIDDFIQKGNEYIVAHPLISIFPARLFYPDGEEQITEFANDVFHGDGFPVSVDGLWELDSNLFSFYDFDKPPLIGGVSEEMQMAAKTIEVLGLDVDLSKILIIKNTSFKANPADTEGEIGDYVFMADVQSEPITLSVSNLYITKSQILYIYENLLSGSIKEITGVNNKTIKVTVKQSAFTVALMKELGVTESDLQGSITDLRKKLVRLAPSAPVPDDDKSLIDWLRKGGVDR
ncbi:hypothetical protein [Serratia marcescens]|uniref:hypothetical protein n=1 Tax=Serratia marcescens TaxID=615 RepID=UPI002176FEC3|nr:hypothetical protein [Serratia marcescens]CAI1918268.1 Uncharacterised protein [Serratia marcescens]